MAEEAQPVGAMAQAVGEVLTERVKSMIPCTCTNTESTVIDKPIADVWAKIRWWKLEEIAPNTITATEWTDGEAGRVDSTVKISYANGAAWFLRVTELSERNHTLAYELVAAEPATSVSSIVGEMTLQAVTDSDQTFFTWSTEYSNDVDAEFVQDARWKKRDLFADVKRTLAGQ